MDLPKIDRMGEGGRVPLQKVHQSKEVDQGQETLRPVEAPEEAAEEKKKAGLKEEGKADAEAEEKLAVKEKKEKTSVHYELIDQGDDVAITVVDEEGEVVREIPPEELREIKDKLRELGGDGGGEHFDRTV